MISSYPLRDPEIARKNAISRYTYLIAKNFPRTQKVVIFCEIDGIKTPFLVYKNILVVPTYKVNSLNFFSDLTSQILKFDNVKNFLIQFEFSIFGGKVVIPQFLILLAFLKLVGKSTKVTFHQVVADLGSLSGHLAIKKNSIKTYFLSLLLRTFYKLAGFFIDKAFVHDGVLAAHLERFVNPSKITIIPHGMAERKRFNQKDSIRAKKYFGVEKNTKLVGIFGYCSWYKGTDWLIENFAKFAKDHKNQKIRLLVAGGESPTLKGTLAYKKYHAKLKKVIREANGNIVYTGYVPQSDVKKVFAACDLMVFPYRTKMSASGAFSLSVGFRKNFIASNYFSENIDLGKGAKNIFSLNYESFEKCLLRNLKHPFGSEFMGDATSWQETANMYLAESLRKTNSESKLEYAKAF